MLIKFWINIHQKLTGLLVWVKQCFISFSAKTFALQQWIQIEFLWVLLLLVSLLVVSDSVWPHRQQPTRLARPWDSPGENTGVGCHCLLCLWVRPRHFTVCQEVALYSQGGESLSWGSDGAKEHKERLGRALTLDVHVVLRTSLMCLAFRLDLLLDKERMGFDGL